MLKVVTLFFMAFLFIYLSFAADHYLDGFWFEVPTIILSSTLCVVHFALMIFNAAKPFAPSQNK